MEPTDFRMLMLRKFIDSKQNIPKKNNIHCVWEKLQKTLQSIT